MPFWNFVWNDEIIRHIAEHGISQDDFERVVCNPISKGLSRATDLPAVWGHTVDGRYIMTVYEQLDPLTICQLRLSWCLNRNKYMKTPKPRRVSRALTRHQREKLERDRRRIARELPDLVIRDQMRKEARDEPTLSGQLRRLIHSSRMSIADIAAQSQIAPLVLDEFLAGERTLRSDVLDRLTMSLGLVFHAPLGATSTRPISPRPA